MAGDWIKMRTGLRNAPKVVRMASALASASDADKRPDRLRVVGALHAVWSLADEHSPDGRLDGYTLQVLDDVIGWPGFSSAMQEVQWLVVTTQGIEVPRFDEHNGASAKRRAMESQRKRVGRASANGPEETGQASALNADRKRTREEKSREDKEIKILAPSPAGSTPFHEELNLSPVFIELPLNTGKTWAVREALVAEWQKLFPAVDVRQQLRSMRAWLDANKSRRKTARGIKAFAARWLAKDQDRGPPTGKPRSGAGELGAKEFD